MAYSENGRIHTMLCITIRKMENLHCSVFFWTHAEVEGSVFEWGYLRLHDTCVPIVAISENKQPLGSLWRELGNCSQTCPL